MPKEPVRREGPRVRPETVDTPAWPTPVIFSAECGQALHQFQRATVQQAFAHQKSIIDVDIGSGQIEMGLALLDAACSLDGVKFVNVVLIAPRMLHFHALDRARRIGMQGRSCLPRDKLVGFCVTTPESAKKLDWTGVSAVVLVNDVARFYKVWKVTAKVPRRFSFVHYHVLNCCTGKPWLEKTK